MIAAVGGWILVLLGVVLAFTGNRLFWLAGGIAGFAFGWLMSVWLLPDTLLIMGLVVAVILAAAAGWATRRNRRLAAVPLGAVLVGLTGLAFVQQWVPGNLLWSTLAVLVGAIAGVVIVRTAGDRGVPLVTAIGGGGLVWTGVGQAIADVPRWIPVITAIVVAVFGFVAQMSTDLDAGDDAPRNAG